MTLSQLDKKLSDACNDFSNQIRSTYTEGSRNPVNETDLNELARQTLYVLDSFKTEIINYLKEH